MVLDIDTEEIEKLAFSSNQREKGGQYFSRVFQKTDKGVLYEGATGDCIITIVPL